MKLRLFLACLVFTCPLFSSIPNASAADLSACLSIRNIQVSVSGGNKVDFSADVYQMCQEFTPVFGGSGVLSKMPTYSLIPLGISCSGPLLKTQRIDPGLSGYYLGAIKCSGTTTSYGTSSTMVQAWLPGESFSVGFSHTSISAARKLAQCTSLENPRSTTSSTSIILQVDVYSICSSLSREYEKPVYQMAEEDSLLNLSSCSGPSLRATSLSKQLMGTATCTLRIGNTHSFLASSRTGATTTTIELFYTWDLSRTSARISHSSIPNSGSSGGTTGGTTGGTPQVVSQCRSAPKTPILLTTWDDKGVTFKFKKDDSGENPTVMQWSYSLFDASSNKWGAWAGWATVGGVETISKTFPPQVDKTKISFSVYAVNSCGSSEQVREISTNVGVPLNVLVVDQYIVNPISVAEVFSKIWISQYISSKNNLGFEITTSTPEICKVDTYQITFESAGSCRLVTKATSRFNIQKPEDISSEIVVSKKKVSLSLKLATPVYVGKMSKATIDSTHPVKLESKSLTPEICAFDYGSIVGLAAGICQVSVTSVENNEFSSVTQVLEAKVWPGEQNFSNIEVPATFSLAQKTLKIDLSLSSGLKIESNSLTPRICNVVDQLVSFIGTGKCSIRFSAPKTPNYLDVSYKDVSFFITDGKSTITCVKGKLIKKVTAVKPKCPSGYKVKK